MSEIVEHGRGRAYSWRMMKRTILLAVAAYAAAAPALAQTQMYPGQGITVNAGAIGASPIYSGQSGPYPGIVYLHMPVVHHHPHVATKPAATTTTTTDVASAPPADTAAPQSAPAATSPYPPPLDSLSDTPAPAAPAHHAHHSHATQATAAPATAPQPSTAPPADGSSNVGDDAALPLALDPQDDHPVSQPPPHRQRADAAKPEKTASIAAAPATTAIVPTHSDAPSAGNLSRRSEILFPRGDPDVSATTVDKMRAVAADLNTLLGAGAQRVQLDAYGGAPGDKGSDARRLSLKRALGIRQLLIEDGVPAERIDVRAMGGIDDSGAPDRVDVMIRAG